MKSKLVGKVKAPHGIRGELFIYVFSKDTSWINRLKAAEIKNPKTGEFVKIEITRKRPHKEGLIITSPQVTDRNHAELIAGFEFYVPEDLLTSAPGETIFLSEILGFDVFLNDSCVGQVEGFSSNGPQDLLIIRNEEHVFEVPFVTTFIVKLDFENQKLLMDFPRELIEINRK